jgi:hypothetical protein
MSQSTSQTQPDNIHMPEIPHMSALITHPTLERQSLSCVVLQWLVVNRIVLRCAQVRWYARRSLGKQVDCAPTGHPLSAGRQLGMISVRILASCSVQMSAGPWGNGHGVMSEGRTRLIGARVRRRNTCTCVRMCECITVADIAGVSTAWGAGFCTLHCKFRLIAAYSWYTPCVV